MQNEHIYADDGATGKWLTVTCTAPTRIDLAGGTLDIAPLAYILMEKYGFWRSKIVTINAAINLNAQVTLQLKEIGGGKASLHAAPPLYTFTDKDSENTFSTQDLDHSGLNGFSLARGALRYFFPYLRKQNYQEVIIKTKAMAPRGSGLGGSSTLMICLLWALNQALDAKIDHQKLCLAAQNIESGILGNLAGNQDHLAAANGGIQRVEHTFQGPVCYPILGNGHELLEHIVLAYSKQPHFSAYSNWTVMQQVLSGGQESVSKLCKIAECALELEEHIIKMDLHKIGSVMQREWEIRRTLADGISTPTLDAMAQNALNEGAMGTKVCGAGGGGVLMAVIPHKNARSRVVLGIEKAGGQVIDAQFSASGVTSTPLEKLS